MLLCNIYVHVSVYLYSLVFPKYCGVVYFVIVVILCVVYSRALCSVSLCCAFLTKVDCSFCSCFICRLCGDVDLWHTEFGGIYLYAYFVISVCVLVKVLFICWIGMWCSMLWYLLYFCIVTVCLKSVWHKWHCACCRLWIVGFRMGSGSAVYWWLTGLWVGGGGILVSCCVSEFGSVVDGSWWRCAVVSDGFGCYVIGLIFPDLGLFSMGSFLHRGWGCRIFANPKTCSF